VVGRFDREVEIRTDANVSAAPSQVHWISKRSLCIPTLPSLFGHA
jgi:hypothetical protein